LGIGTIKNGAQAQAFIDAGADYIISPGLVEDAAAVADKNGVLWVPGAMTPTEIIRAEKLRSNIHKNISRERFRNRLYKCDKRTV
jgi:2-dehydro-3-deoxyphosphogluconate aldolase/(4S)-4-hydroxy-2-oxoglutarate aldolase